MIHRPAGLRPTVPAILLGAAALLLLGDAWAQKAPSVEGIYTCTDSGGRRLRSDRPIPECSDREQTLLNPSGTVRGRVGPTLTAQQREALQARQKAEADERAQVLEEKRRDRALLTRYPSRQVHDKEREQALAQIANGSLTASKRIEALLEERKKIDQELEFYRNDPSRAPAALRRQIDYVEQGLQTQRRFIELQTFESRRIDARFDDELVRLQDLWEDRAPAAAAAPPKGVKP